MNVKNYEQRLQEYKLQKYRLMVAKQNVESSYSGGNDLEAMIDESLELVNSAINTTARIIKNLNALESEFKGYRIIESRLEEIMFEYNLVEASTRMNGNKLNQVGEELVEYQQLTKHKNK